MIDQCHLGSSGKVRAIGVSNFSEMKLQEILPTAEILPAVDQVRCEFVLMQPNEVLTSM